jgi:hypothetical protein
MKKMIFLGLILLVSTSAQAAKDIAVNIANETNNAVTLGLRPNKEYTTLEEIKANTTEVVVRPLALATKLVPTTEFGVSIDIKNIQPA